MTIYSWLSDNYIEIFGAITGIIYVFLEVRQNIWLWPVGILTSAAYIWIFFTGKLYADMSLQGYYLVISILGWYWWVKGTGLPSEALAKDGHRAEGTEHGAEPDKLPSLEGQGVGTDGTGQEEENGRPSFAEASEGKRRGESESGSEGLWVSNLKLKTGLILGVVFILLYTGMWLVLDRLTDSPVPQWDSLITSLSIIATWMLARKIYEHWYLWLVVNTVSAILFFSRGLYPTVILYIIYGIMSYAGLKAWKRSIEKLN